MSVTSMPTCQGMPMNLSRGCQRKIFDFALVPLFFLPVHLLSVPCSQEDQGRSPSLAFDGLRPLATLAACNRLRGACCVGMLLVGFCLSFGFCPLRLVLSLFCLSRSYLSSPSSDLRSFFPYRRYLNNPLSQHCPEEPEEELE